MEKPCRSNGLDSRPNTARRSSSCEEEVRAEVRFWWGIRIPMAIEVGRQDVEAGRENGRRHAAVVARGNSNGEAGASQRGTGEAAKTTARGGFLAGDRARRRAPAARFGRGDAWPFETTRRQERESVAAGREGLPQFRAPAARRLREVLPGRAAEPVHEDHQGLGGVRGQPL